MQVAPSADHALWSLNLVQVTESISGSVVPLAMFLLTCCWLCNLPSNAKLLKLKLSIIAHMDLDQKGGRQKYLGKKNYSQNNELFLTNNELFLTCVLSIEEVCLAPALQCIRAIH